METDKMLWPGWETIRLIGRGSFGAVYEIARDNYGHKEKAALKVISIPQSASDIDDLVSDGYDEQSITSRFEGYMQDIVREYSMMADMKGMMPVINMSLKSQGKPEMTLDEVVIRLFDEVEYVWPKVGYPPLVTPFSQYVKNTALMNLFNMLSDKPRWSTIDKDTWGMILGNMGRLPGKLAPEIVELAKSKGLEFSTGNPQDNYPDELPHFRQIMKEEGWDEGEDQEELFEFAMHERQYRDYKSGIAKERFNKELEDFRAKAGAPINVVRPVVEMPKFDIDGFVAKHPEAIPVQAPVKGQLLWQVDVIDDSKAPVAGTKVESGKPMGFVQTYYGMEEILPAADGQVITVTGKQGEHVEKGEIVAFIQSKN